ncbi:glycosyltransferase [Pedobacter miscanthi]|uniref:glycosyltransferase n=1 Tax=Pedobacter miscanthi TaxID=2259170 RepID=UPI002931B0C4|nr:glycosyltransferase [Pedobacter miscanthi]
MKTISVIIPTYNRSNLISITLESFARQNYPNECFEIIVMNNNSTDNTARIVKELMVKYPIIKYYEEPRQGVHYARNSAVKYAKSEILYYTDDDMIADPELLATLVKTFDLDPNIAVVGGKVLPNWEVPPPEWVLKYCVNTFLSLNPDDTDLIISDKMINVFSCHEAIKREAFLKSGGFNPENTKGTWIGDGETGLSIKILKLGYKQAYNGSSIIYHIIPKSRMTQSYLNKRLANHGNCDSYTIYKATNGMKKSELLKNIARNAKNLINKCLATVWYMLNFRDKWRLSLAQSFYHRNRILYDIKLFYSPGLRKLVLKNNWFDNDLNNNCQSTKL